MSSSSSIPSRPNVRAHGGVEIGSAFLGWLSATGAIVLLVAVAAAVVASIGATTGGIDEAAGDAAQQLQATGIWGALLVIWFIGFYGGGYVAARMAGRSGVAQGIAVWAWGVVIAIALTVIGLLVGQNLSLSVGAMPSLPLPVDQAAIGAILSIVAAAVVPLAGSILGGKAGMHHRAADPQGQEHESDIVVERLQRTLDSRILIEQAKGVLAESAGVKVDEAFAILRDHARNHNLSLGSVAEGVVHGTLHVRGSQRHAIPSRLASERVAAIHRQSRIDLEASAPR